MSGIKSVWQVGKDAWKQNGIPLGRFRRISEFEKVSTNLWSTDHARLYVERIIGLADLLQAPNGVPAFDSLAEHSGRTDSDIGVAIGENGEILHFRKGHHRIMIARQLGARTMPVSVEIVHANWLATACKMSKSKLSDAISRRCPDTAGTIREAIWVHMRGQN